VGTSPTARTYRCLEGEIAIDVRSAEQWQALAHCLGRPELAYEGWEAVKEAPEDGHLAEVLVSMFAEEPADLWKRRLQARGVPCR